VKWGLIIVSTCIGIWLISAQIFQDKKPAIPTEISFDEECLKQPAPLYVSFQSGGQAGFEPDPSIPPTWGDYGEKTLQEIGRVINKNKNDYFEVIRVPDDKYMVATALFMASRKIRGVKSQIQMFAYIGDRFIGHKIASGFTKTVRDNKRFWSRNTTGRNSTCFSQRNPVSRKLYSAVFPITHKSTEFLSGKACFQVQLLKAACLNINVEDASLVQAVNKIMFKQGDGEYGALSEVGIKAFSARHERIR